LNEVIDALARRSINVEHLGEGAGRWRGDSINCALDKRNNIQKADPASKKRRYRNFIGSI
jgi:hypothetical protein